MTIHSDGLQSGSDRSIARGPDRVRLRSLSREDVRHVLDNDRRREVIRCVRDADAPMPICTLVARLADAEHDATAVTTLLDRRQRVHVSLRRTHLPLLESHGIVAYDRDAGVVSPGANLDAIDSLSERASSRA